MNFIKRAYARRTLSLVVLAASAGPVALAAESGVYFGGNYGQSQADIDDERINAALLNAGVTSVSIADDDSDTGFKLFGGYQFNRSFALEAGYFDLGKFGFVASTTPVGTLAGRTTKIEGANLDLIWTLHFNDKVSAFARGGATYVETASSYTNSGVVISSPASGSKETSGYKFGLGLQYDFTDRFGLRGEAERYRIDDAVSNKGDIDLFSLGFVYRFFDRTPAASTSEAYVPPPPRVADPVQVIVPAPVQSAKYCSILDFEFEINRDEIQREEKEKLAVVGTFMQKYPDTTAVIEGHTDDVGTSEDNLKLSQRRADSVVNYLVNDLQIARARLTAIGYGEARPIGNEGSSEGRKANRRINAVIACAQDIEGLAVSPVRATMALEMEFDPNTAQIQPEYREGLAQVASFLKANPAVTATVEGHSAKFSGASQQQISPQRAIEVSKQRAQNVVDYLVNELGIARSRLSAQGFGQSRRVSYGTTLEGQQENRRVNIILNYPKR